MLDLDNKMQLVDLSRDVESPIMQENEVEQEHNGRDQEVKEEIEATSFEQ